METWDVSKPIIPIFIVISSFSFTFSILDDLAGFSIRYMTKDIQQPDKGFSFTHHIILHD
ncbi:hypothetical protein HMPREF9412_4998 [Paenibacillus sp. HGF5]|nr:hypothetical protein HMPREF9412_4998 [Paenibacillus sp. HGF5]